MLSLDNLIGPVVVRKSKTKMSKFISISIAVVLAGIVLLAFGLESAGSVSSSVTHALGGTQADKTIWLIALGAAGIIASSCGNFTPWAP